MAEKAYDFKVLEAKLKEKGLPEIEDLAEKVYEGFKEWVAESAMASENKYDDLIIAIFPVLDTVVNKEIDKISDADDQPAQV